MFAIAGQKAGPKLARTLGATWAKSILNFFNFHRQAQINGGSNNE